MDFASILSNNTFIFITLIWTLPWKGFALWKASRNEEKWWFVAILLTNTFALLDVLYIFYFSERKKRGKDKKRGVGVKVKNEKERKLKVSRSDSSNASNKKVIKKKK